LGENKHKPADLGTEPRPILHFGRKQTQTHFELGTEPRPILGENKQYGAAEEMAAR
jgi:hypothetical protein